MLRRETIKSANTILHISNSALQWKMISVVFLSPAVNFVIRNWIFCTAVRKFFLYISYWEWVLRGSLHTNFVRLLISRRTRHSRCLVNTQTVYRLMSVSVSAATLQLLHAAYTAIAGAVYLAYCPSLLHALHCIGIAVAKHRRGLYKQILPWRVCVWHFYPRDAMLTRVY